VVSARWITQARPANTYKSVPVQVLDRVRGKGDVLKLDKAHGSVDLLTEAHALEALAALEQAAQRLLEEVGRVRWGRNGREIAYVERVDLKTQHSLQSSL
jgi:hypothetical protein